MDWTLEVVVVPVSEVDRAIAFYRDQVRLRSRSRHSAQPTQRFAQLTPPGSGCSIVIREPSTDASRARSRVCSWSSPTPTRAHEELTRARCCGRGDRRHRRTRRRDAVRIRRSRRQCVGGAADQGTCGQPVDPTLKAIPAGGVPAGIAMGGRAVSAECPTAPADPSRRYADVP